MTELDRSGRERTEGWPFCSGGMRLGRVFRFADDLTAFETLVLWIRLASSALIIALGLAVIIGPITAPTTFRIATFGTKSTDIIGGLFKELKQAVEVYGSTDVNNGVGLTTSEIFILTSYTASQINNVPQYIAISIYGRCDISFNTTQGLDKEGHVVDVRNSSVVEVCYNTGRNYVFDYREVLAQLGMDIVLVYAYDQEVSAPLGLSQSYNEYVTDLRRKKVNMVNLLISALVLESAIVILSLWFYAIKGRLINPLKERVINHTISLLSFVVFLLGFTGTISLAWLSFRLKSRITSELSVYGFTYGLGFTWFTCLWLFAFNILVSTLAWSGLEWCISDTQQPFNDGTQNDILRYQTGVLTDAGGASIDEFPDNQDSNDNHLRLAHGGGRSSSFGSDSAEEVELQDIALYSSDDSEANFKRTIKPSSTMFF